jgi:hypothetical protein
MNSGIPFIKIADRVEVTVDLKGKRLSGPPLVFKQLAVRLRNSCRVFVFISANQSRSTAMRRKRSDSFPHSWYTLRCCN